jgi:hypothetical protein
MHFHKHFTAAEATRTLPLVRSIVSDIFDTGRRLEALLTVAEREATLSELRYQIVPVRNELRRYWEELEELGCTFRYWNSQMGVVDFPAVIDGEEVMLSWRTDESEVRYYHTLRAGYIGRRPVPERHWQSYTPAV